ncbi:MAG: lactate dehydrogenase [Methanoregula sp.]|uniref:malate dehydrogenase n=1 Tax=Methanoregula sp. TaxID=2052170 RepID=UPI003BB0CB3A
MTRLAVMGVGRIGGEVAYLATILGLVDELVLYDQSASLLKAQVLDIQHTGVPVSVTTETRDIREADICIFAAGTPRTPADKTRADLIAANIPVIRKCAELLDGFSGILVTVTNPMDVNNFLMSRLTGIPRERCIGFGGQLDSARFSLALRQRHIRGKAVVLGEHGNYQVPIFSRLLQPVTEDIRDTILDELRGASMEVIKGKGGTVFGPAYHIATLIRLLLSDSQETIPCSAVLEGEYGISECSLGVPVRVGRTGIEDVITWNLDPWEQAGIVQAGAFVRDLCRTVVI